VLVLAAAGFAVASIAAGSSSVVAQTTGTTGATTTPSTQTVTVTVTQTSTVTRTARVTICHRTGKKRPFAVTIKVPAGSLFTHFRHGDLPGRCTAAKIKKMKKSGKRR
jgi:hypothetical protein